MCSLGGRLDPKNEKYVASFPKQGLVPLCSCHYRYLEGSTGDKVQSLTLFLLLSLSQSVNRRLVVNV